MYLKDNKQDTEAHVAYSCPIWCKMLESFGNIKTFRVFLGCDFVPPQNTSLTATGIYSER